MAKKASVKTKAKAEPVTKTGSESTNLEEETKRALEERAILSAQIERILDERQDLRRKGASFWDDPNRIAVWVSAFSLCVAVFAAWRTLTFAIETQDKTNALLGNEVSESIAQRNTNVAIAAIRTGQDESSWRQAAANLVLLDDLGVFTLDPEVKTELRIKAGNANPGLPRHMSGEATTQATNGHVPGTNPPLEQVFGQ